MELIGDKLPKYGDRYERGPAFFTKTQQLTDELEAKYLIDIEVEAKRKIKGIPQPKERQFIPVLQKLKAKAKDI